MLLLILLDIFLLVACSLTMDYSTLNFQQLQEEIDAAMNENDFERMNAPKRSGAAGCDARLYPSVDRRGGERDYQYD